MLCVYFWQVQVEVYCNLYYLTLAAFQSIPTLPSTSHFHSSSKD